MSNAENDCHNAVVTSLSRRQLLAGLAAAAALGAPRRTVQEIRRFPAPEAHQAVSVDAEAFYAIDNTGIVRYDKHTGKRLAAWTCERGHPLIHLNSGVVRDGVLYCAHSNYPEQPMVSSVEMWDARSLRHSGSFSFGISSGSATWVDFLGDHRYVNFAHYSNRAAEPNRDPRWTTLVQYDRQWQRLQSWIYPAEVVSRLGQYSISGGVFAGGRLLCTGHDNPELYVLKFPEGGSTLELEEIVATPNHGQGIALDPAEPDTLYAIDRATSQVIVLRLLAT